MSKTQRFILSPSILNADLSMLKDEIQSLEAAGMDWVHLDVMDGVFVPNISFAFPVLDAIKKITNKPIDAHLMIIRPDQYASEFAKRGAEYVTIHPESDGNIEKAITDIQTAGAKAGLSIKPKTPAAELQKYSKYNISMALIMSVEPGFGGQSFKEGVLPKFREVRKILGDDCILQIDGGISEKTIKQAYDAGCESFVIGSALTKLPFDKRKQAVEGYKRMLGII